MHHANLSPRVIAAQLLILLLSIAVRPHWLGQSADDRESPKPDAFATNRSLGSGINLGNMLEAPSEGDWTVSFHDDYAKIIRDAGLTHVRLPVRWSAHTSSQPPYEIDPVFVKRVRHIVDTCIQAKLSVVLNVHHFEEIYESPVQQQAKLVAIWKQISHEFRDAPDQLLFELLNEPRAQLSTAIWNDMIPGLLAEVRALHPKRGIIIGAGRWNSYEELKNLRLPEDDRMLIATFHYYLPFDFTHQGVEFLENAPPSGRPFPKNDREMSEIKSHFAQVSQWSAKNRRPVYLGEFGVTQNAVQTDRTHWVQTVASDASDRGFSMAYWEFCSQFGLWNPETRLWNTDMIRAIASPEQTDLIQPGSAKK